MDSGFESELCLRVAEEDTVHCTRLSNGMGQGVGTPHRSIKIRKLNSFSPKPERSLSFPHHAHSESPRRFTTGRAAGAFAELQLGCDLQICMGHQQQQRKWIVSNF